MFLPAELDGLLSRLDARVTDMPLSSDMKEFARCAMASRVDSPSIVRAVIDGTLTRVARAPGVSEYLGIRVSVKEVKEKLHGT